jgi:pyruvate,orthophosphate dikinase
VLYYPFHHPHEDASRSSAEVLGGKGAGLAMMAGELGLPVPPGFTITTRACRDYLERGWSVELEDALRQGMRGVEAETGRRFGDAEAPLFVSVRSGAPVSMPGMLDTILNVGLNAQTRRALEIEDDTFAAECQRNLEIAYSASVGQPPPDDPWEQLRGAVEAVFRSVRSRRSLAYRRRQGLVDAPVTAVNVQTMIFGNRDQNSATGVLFTRDPATGENRFYGDLLFCAQGDDVVSGRRQTESIDSLGARLPQVAKALGHAARRLEYRLRDLCEIEFTIERGRLWLLQVRIGKCTPRSALRIASELAQDPEFPLDRREAVSRVVQILADPPRLSSLPGSRDALSTSELTHGLGASPGVVSGEVAIDFETMQSCEAAGRDAILVRPETSPEDVEAMSLARGLLTARGGLASHAAVIARSWGVPAVVGVEALLVEEQSIVIAGRRFGVGDTITIDGSSGSIYAGVVEASESVAPEAVQMLEWAKELGIEVERRDANETNGLAPDGRAAAPNAGLTGQADGDTAESIGNVDSVDVDRLIGVLEIKGFASGELLAPALEVSLRALEEAIEELASTGLISADRPQLIGLTEAGRARATALLQADRAALGLEAATRALDAFQAFDARVKAMVTNWQLRPIGDELVPNDHSDAVWDEAVFVGLAELFDEAGSWLEMLVPRLPRLGTYAGRLGRALEAAREGDGRFVASPRVDSFHSIWFELHEDLIRLAGRTRAEEVAAGRAG